MTASDPHEPVTVTDKRRIDPETGEIREDPAGRTRGIGTAGPAPSGPAPEAAPAPDEAAELKATLQRVKAEYDNYRKRSVRQEQAAAERAKVAVVAQLLPVLDDLDRARSHGDLESGPLKSVADKLVTVLEGLGLSAFGDEGEEFDPASARSRAARGRRHPSRRRPRDAARLQGRRSGGAPRPGRRGRHRAGHRRRPRRADTPDNADECRRAGRRIRIVRRRMTW